MLVVPVTGRSGSGKSTVRYPCCANGLSTVDTDYGDRIDRTGSRGGARIDALIAEHEHSNEPLFIAGTVVNQGTSTPGSTSS